MACEVCNDGCCIISFGCIIKNTPLNTFTDENDLMLSLELAQSEIKTEIQKECYDELCAAIADVSNNPIPDEFQKLIKILRKPLAWLSFTYWLEWYSNITFGDSVTTTTTDRNSNGFSNISEDKRLQMIKDARSKYETYLNNALIELKELDLDCYEDKDKCKPCSRKNVDDELSFLPDVV